MSMQLSVIILSICMLVTGSINTISTKYQDLTVVGAGPHGPVYFFHPAFQSACMFAGELLCLLPYVASYLLKRAHEERHGPRPGGGPIELRRQSAHSWRALASFSVPAACDACATTLLNLGLFYTYASAFQMLRGTLVFFAGLLTIVILKRRLYLHNWMGMMMIVAGAALVGGASLISDDFEPGGDYDYLGASGVGHDYDGGGAAISRLLYMGRRGLKSLQLLAPGVGEAEVGKEHGGGSGAGGGVPTALLGNLFVVAAQFAAASQFVVEEKYLVQYRVPTLLAVGLEGFYGLVICAIACPLLSNVTFCGQPVDSWGGAVQALRDHPSLAVSTAVSIASIAAFNVCGVKVTKRLSGAARAAVDACRTLFVWGASLALGWEPSHPPLRIALQVAGFMVLVSGSSLYNELLRSCLPTAPALGGSDDSLEPLLGGEGGAGGGAGEGVRAARQRAGGSTPFAAAPRRIKHVDSYTLARSMRMPPQGLSPHSLSSFGRLARGGFGGSLGGGVGGGEDGDSGMLSTSYCGDSSPPTPNGGGPLRWGSGGMDAGAGGTSSDAQFGSFPSLPSGLLAREGGEIAGPPGDEAATSERL